MNAITFLALTVFGGLLIASCTAEDKSGYTFGKSGGGTSGGPSDRGGAGGSSLSGTGGGSAGRVGSGSSGAGIGGHDTDVGGDAGAGGTGGEMVVGPPDACAAKPCANGGTCEADGAGFICTCAPGYSGDACQIESDSCDPNPCVNGTCEGGVGSFTCTCSDGFEGKLCDAESDECAPNPCKNGGTCVDGPARYSCDCPAGFSGTTCEVSVSGCVDKPCLNGGTCKDGASAPAYTCTCPVGFTGNNCQTDINECSPTNPCQHGGTCSNVPAGSFTCNCAGTGYTGTTCQTDVNECSTPPCQNGSTCTNTPAGSYTCACAARFTGKNCEFQKFRGMGMLALDTNSYVNAISGDGTVAVGQSGGSQDNTTHAVRFVGAGPLQYLPTPTGSDSCSAVDVTTNGQLIVATCTAWIVAPPAGTPDMRAFKYTSSTGFVYVSPSPMASTDATSVAGISGDGNVIAGGVGSLTARWTAASGWVDIGRLTPPPGSNSAGGINQDGSVIVGKDAVKEAVAWRWTAATGQLQLTRPNTSGSFIARSVSANGNVIVGSENSTGDPTAIRWLNGTPTALGVPGDAWAASADGSVVVGELAGVATVWSSTGAASSVASLLGATSDLTGWTLTYAADVSDNGKVVVGGGDHGGKLEGWIAHLP